MLTPESPEALAAALAEANSRGERISLGGNFSKNALGGPLPEDAVEVSTRLLKRVLIFEPKDLTISVEAGLPWMELTRLLDNAGMMIPLDPPFADQSTVGGVVATNLSGPRRRLYGTARDLVIGMKFAMLDGKIAQSGGMVVKNVAGLDMGKLMIGSFGTLAAMTSVNFKLIPKPASARTFRISGALTDVIERRDAILRSVLQPMAVDLLNPAAAVSLGLEGWTLLVEAGGNERVLDRYARELAPAAEADQNLWHRVREFTRDHLARGAGAWFRTRTHKLMDLRDVLQSWEGPALARAANGVTYLYGEGGPPFPAWPETGNDFPPMQRIKKMFDPKGLLNPGRLYGRI
jgi:glycolate oxidase FAD binding subunit